MPDHRLQKTRAAYDERPEVVSNRYWDSQWVSSDYATNRLAAIYIRHANQLRNDGRHAEADKALAEAARILGSV